MRIACPHIDAPLLVDDENLNHRRMPGKTDDTAAPVRYHDVLLSARSDVALACICRVEVPLLVKPVRTTAARRT